MNFHIKEVIAIGKEKRPASVSFTNGLNIICGVSDSGKTSVLKSIYFLLGGDAPFDTVKTGYDTIQLIVGTPHGDIQMTRKLGKNSIDVVSQNSQIKSGFYSAGSRQAKGNLRPINDIWLQLIGISETPQVISNQNYDRVSLTLRMMSSLFWLKEERIERPKSVILPEEKIQQTRFLSGLIYLISGEDFKDIESFDKDTVSTAKRNVLNEFVGGQLNTVIQRRDNLKEKLLEFGTVDVEAKAEEIIQNLSEIEEKIFEKTNQSQNLLEELLDLKEQETERRLVFNQFQTLKSQYIADIKRLGLIVNGEEHFHELEENTLCPFCENPLPPEKQPSYLEAAQAELQRILSQLEGLEESIQDVQSQIDILQQKIQELNQKLLEIEQLLNRELTPQSENFRNTLSHYQQYSQLSHEFEFLSQYSDTLYDDLREATKIPERPKVYKPREHFPENFLNQLNQIAYQILEECQYEGLKKSHFNPTTFDLEINDLIKEHSHGKGHWAFINTVLGLTFRSYLHQSAKFSPNLFIVDTPLLGLDQGVSDEAPESMRTALFQYFIRYQNEGQTIVIENTKDLPDLDYVEQGVKIIDFTNNKYQSKYENRAGFLYDI